MRRFIRSALAAFSILLAAAPAAAFREPNGTAVAAAKTSIELPASKGRKIPLTVWTVPAAASRGVVIFGHGFGSQPAAYGELIAALTGHGYSVVAPLSVDSMAYADRAKFDLRTGLAARIEDLMIVRGFVASTFPGQKVALAGHSYGATMSLIGGGADTAAGALKGPPVAALLALSSAGTIPGLIRDDSFAPIALPLMVVTGTKDTVPQFVADPRAHRLAFDTSKAGDKYLLTVADGAHDLVVRGDSATRAAVIARILAFLDAYVGGDAGARAALSASPATTLFVEERR